MSETPGSFTYRAPAARQAAHPVRRETGAPSSPVENTRWSTSFQSDRGRKSVSRTTSLLLSIARLVPDTVNGAMAVSCCSTAASELHGSGLRPESAAGCNCLSAPRSAGDEDCHSAARPDGAPRAFFAAALRSRTAHLLAARLQREPLPDGPPHHPHDMAGTSRAQSSAGRVGFHHFACMSAVRAIPLPSLNR
jgi:hypothetical protein